MLEVASVQLEMVDIHKSGDQRLRLCFEWRHVLEELTDNGKDSTDLTSLLACLLLVDFSLAHNHLHLEMNLTSIRTHKQDICMPSPGNCTYMYVQL